jgi:K+-sensing histidine kinase KdpD
MEPWLEAFARANFLRSADTAHDLKTPLNVAVLNLELLRMRLAKIADASKDEKISGYAAAIETELRRMAKIFDAFFLLSTPPKAEGSPAPVEIVAICKELGFDLPISSPVIVRAHESRIRQGLKMFFEGASKIFNPKTSTHSAERAAGWLHISMRGQSQSADFDISKIFKFYYTDSDGNPDLSLATARLIAETYGGRLDAAQEHDKVELRFSLPLGDQ